MSLRGEGGREEIAYGLALIQRVVWEDLWATGWMEKKKGGRSAVDRGTCMRSIPIFLMRFSAPCCVKVPVTSVRSWSLLATLLCAAAAGICFTCASVVLSMYSICSGTLRLTSPKHEKTDVHRLFVPECLYASRYGRKRQS